MSLKRWNYLKPNKETAMKLAEETGVSAFLCLLLQNSGISDFDSADDFLNPDQIELENPFDIKDIEKAAERINSAIEVGEKIAIYGDYDADGVTATALLYSYLEVMCEDIMYYLPKREAEGYGLNISAIEKLADAGVKLIITVDNGISAHKEIDYANSLGIDVVVTDHHQASEILPNAYAVVNPHRLDDTSKSKNLCGVGVAFKLICAMEPDNIPFLLATYADLLAIGTVADIMPLMGENRCFITHGIRSIENSERPGISALLNVAGLSGKAVTSTVIGFNIAPRINACGRLDAADTALKLLLCEDIEQANQLAQELEENNRKRQEIEKQLLEEVNQKIKDTPELLNDRVIIIDGQGWHQGVIGIVAARITDKYGKPCFIISSDGEMAKGSGRSLEGFSLYKALTACKEYLTIYGGHAQAAGLSLISENIGKLREKINEYARETADIMPLPKIDISCSLNPSHLNLDIVETIKAMEPFGEGNPLPVFALKNLVLSRITPLKEGKHLRLTLTHDGKEISAMKFSTREEELGFAVGDKVDIAVTLDKNLYKDNEYLSVIIKDIKFAGANNEDILTAGQIAEKIIRGESLNSDQAHMLKPEREDFAKVYRYLREVKAYSGRMEILCKRIGSVEYPKFLTAVMCLCDTKLISWSKNADISDIEIMPVSNKVNLEESNTFRCLKQAIGS